MATTKIWGIKGRLTSVIEYAVNPDKTTNPQYSEDELQGLRDVMNYATDDFKTEEQLFVSGINCNPELARLEMIKTKKHFKKLGGTIAYHAYQSFSPNEVTPEQAHTIGCELAQTLWGDRFEVVVATHLNAHCVHNHFVINSVSLRDGRKYNDSKKTYREMRCVSDALCEQHNLSVIYNPQPSTKKCYPSAVSERDGGFTKNAIIKRDIDECIRLSSNMNNFYKEMKELGYSFDFTHKYTTISHPDFPKARRLKTLGENYTEESITERVLKNIRRGEAEVIIQEKPEDLFFDGDISNAQTIIGYKATYTHYVFGLRIVMERPTSNRQMLFLLKDELVKLDKLIAENNFVVDNDIDTPEKLNEFETSTDKEIAELIDVRTKLSEKLSNACLSHCKSEEAELKEHITAVSARISKLRKNKRLSVSVRERFPQITEQMAVIESEIKSESKEVKNNELIRRRGGTNRENESKRS